MKTPELSIKELAAFIGVSTDTIRRAVRRGEIPSTRVGTALRFDLHQVLHQMERNAVVRLQRGSPRAPASVIVKRSARGRAHNEKTCSSSYGGHTVGMRHTVWEICGLLGGFTDSRIDENTFSISVDTNGLTGQQTTSMHTFYRAAELTVENGFDYFVIASDANNSTSMAMALPGGSTSNTTINTYGSTAYGRTTTTYAPTTVVPVVYPNSTLIIKSFKGAKPEGAPNAYDARTVMKYIGPQIGVEQGKKP